MDFKINISEEEMLKIRREVVSFHLEGNKKIMIFMRIAMIYVIVYSIIQSLLTEFTPVSIALIVLFVILYIYTLGSNQKKLSSRNIIRTYKKYRIDYITQEYRFSNDELFIESNIGPINIKSSYKLHNIKRRKILVEDNLIIFTTGKIMSNFNKSRPRYIYYANLSEQEKLKLIDLL